jgi:hypothetical protein
MEINTSLFFLWRMNAAEDMYSMAANVARFEIVCNRTFKFHQHRISQTHSSFTQYIIAIYSLPATAPIACWLCMCFTNIKLLVSKQYVLFASKWFLLVVWLQNCAGSLWEKGRNALVLKVEVPVTQYFEAHHFGFNAHTYPGTILTCHDAPSNLQANKQKL